MNELRDAIKEHFLHIKQKIINQKGESMVQDNVSEVSGGHEEDLMKGIDEDDFES